MAPKVDPPAWFVVPVMPGIISQIAGYFKGSHGTYKVVKTFVGHPLYNQYTTAGYGPPYSSYAAAAAAAKQLAATGAANALPGAGFNPIPPGSSAQQGASFGLGDIGKLAATLTDRHTWVRIAEFIVGGGLIYIGIHSMSKGTALAPIVNAPANIAKAGVKATPIGRAASKVTKVAKG